jgi:hypothetical protein
MDNQQPIKDNGRHHAAAEYLPHAAAAGTNY